MARTLSFKSVEELIRNAPQGVTEEQILSGLKKRGIEVQGMTFGQRLGKSFGTREDIEEIKRAEVLSGTRGRFEVGDIADVAGKALTFAGFAAGAPFGVVGSAAGAALGETARQAIGRTIGEREKFDIGEVAFEGITAGVAGGVAKIGAPLLKSVFKGGKEIAKGGAVKIAKPVSDFFFGHEGTTGIVSRFKEPKLTEEFVKAARRQPGGKATEDIVTLLNKSIAKVANRARGLFIQAEGKIVDKPIAKESLKGIRQTIKTFVDESALDQNQLRIANRVVDVLKGVGKPSTKSVLKAKRLVRKLFRGSESFKQTDALVTKVANQLDDLIGGVDTAFQTASKAYSVERDFLRKLGVNIAGKSPKVSIEQTATKLYQLAKDLDNPFKREASERLLRQLGARTRIDFIRLLRALKTAENLSPQQARGLRSGITRELVRLLEVGISGAAGKLGRFRLPQPPELLRQGIRRGIPIGTFGAAREIINQ